MTLISALFTRRHIAADEVLGERARRPYRGQLLLAHTTARTIDRRDNFVENAAVPTLLSISNGGRATSIGRECRGKSSSAEKQRPHVGAERDLLSPW
jgi:hypothetical protein